MIYLQNLVFQSGLDLNVESQTLGFWAEIRKNPHAPRQARIRAPHLKRALDTGMKTLEYRKSERLHGGVNRTLLPDELAAVSAILGREYSEIKIIRHSLFNCDAFSCFISSVPTLSRRSVVS